MSAASTEQDLQLILASIADGLLVYTPDSRIRLSNERARFLLGITKEHEQVSLSERLSVERISDVAGNPIPLERAPVYRALHGETVRNEVVCISPIGQQPRWLRFSVSPLIGPDGVLTGAIATFDDVTREQELERQLHSTMQRYRLIFEHSLDAIILTRPDGRIDAVNPAACELLGKTEEEIIAGGREASVEPNAEFERVREERARTGSARGELHLRRRDGSPVVCDTSSAVFTDEDGEPRTIVIARDATERKRAQQVLVDSEARLRELADAMPQLVWIAGPDGTRVYYNGHANDFAGLEKRPDGTWSWLPMVHPDDLRSSVEGWERAVRAGEPYETILRLRVRDGSHRWFLSRAVPIRDASGQVLRWYGTSTDIERQKQTEEQLKESEERFRQLADAMPQLVWTARPDGRTDYYNERAREYAGLEQLADGTWTWEAPIHPDDRQEAAEAWVRAVRTGEVYEQTYRVRRRDGSWRWHLSRGLPVRDAEGRVVRWYGTATDIDWQKLAEQQLKENEERFRQLADAMPQLVWTARPDGTVDYFNERACEYAGIERLADGTWTWGATLHPDDRQAVAEAWEHSLRAGERLEVTSRIRRRDGTYCWHLTRGLPVRDAEGRIIRWYSTTTDIDWQKRAEQQLKESEERFRQLADAMPQLVWTARPDGTVDYFNERAREYSGLERLADGTWSWSEMLHPDDRQAAGEAWERSIRFGEIYEQTNRVRRCDGSYSWRLTRGLPVRDAEGRVVRWFGTSTDIDWQKRAEQQIKESEERFRQLANAMPQLVWTARPDGTLDYANERIREFPTAEHRSDGTISWAAAIHPDDRPATDVAWARAVSSGEVFEISNRIKVRDGSYRWFLSRALPVRDAEGRIVRWYGTTTDIDAQKRTEQALKESEERFRQLADAMPQLVWAARPDGTIDYANARIREFPSHQHLPDGTYSWAQAIHPDDRRATDEAWTRAVSSGEGFEISHRIMVRDGSYRWFLSRALPARDDSGRIVRWYSTTTDIDWQKRAELELVEADRRKDRALATVAHELRNPLGTIHAAVHLLRRYPPTEAAPRRAVETIDRQVRQLTRVVSDLLDVSRISQGKTHLVFERHDLCEVARRTAEDYRPTFVEKGIELVVSICPTPLFGQIDATRVGQALGNLLDNAAKFTPEGGRVAVTVDAEGGFARIGVKDTGAGIPPTALQRIFEQFAQADETLDRSRKGLGLGLALVKGIVELHGGRVAARSEGPGHGSEFVVHLPAAPAELQPEAPPPG